MWLTAIGFAVLMLFGHSLLGFTVALFLISFGFGSFIGGDGDA